ncbi:MAG: type II toxin-antitoxin system RelE/ParE family toxin [Chloroflexota bacterium]|nr:type II toxin-antitoxin system RelE/ParE family toxin [Chloroflexota bacterium]MDE2894570.1 type II toxin-antitoxin system RelE/ParE family toxin [Chloroflexota bacterium]
MILRIRHRGLRRLHEQNDGRYLPPQHVDKITDMLALLDIAADPKDVDVPGWRLHSLRGEYRGFWSISVSANERIVFRFEGADVTDVDFLDYH